MEQIQNEEIPTKVNLGANYKWFPEGLESAECKGNFLSFLVFIQCKTCGFLPEFFALSRFQPTN